MILLLRQRCDDLPESHEALVDLDRLFANCIPGESLPFTASQIYKLKCAHDDIVRLLGVNALQSDLQHRVGPATGLVHVMGSNHFVLDPEVIERQDVLSRAALERVEILNGEEVLDELEFEARSISQNALEVRLVQQVVNFLLVDLQVRAVYSVLLKTDAGLPLDELKQHPNRPRYDSFVLTALDDSSWLAPV